MAGNAKFKQCCNVLECSDGSVKKYCTILAQNVTHWSGLKFQHWNTPIKKRLHICAARSWLLSKNTHMLLRKVPWGFSLHYASCDYRWHSDKLLLSEQLHCNYDLEPITWEQLCSLLPKYWSLRLQCTFTISAFLRSNTEPVRMAIHFYAMISNWIKI